MSSSVAGVELSQSLALDLVTIDASANIVSKAFMFRPPPQSCPAFMGIVAAELLILSAGLSTAARSPNGGLAGHGLANCPRSHYVPEVRAQRCVGTFFSLSPI